MAKKKHISLDGKFGVAFRGVWEAICDQSSFRYHFVGAAFIYSLGLFLQLPITEWAIINSAIMFVLIAELLNTAIEELSDRVTLEVDIRIRKVKDIAAGAVLVSVLNAIISGVLILGPRVWGVLESIIPWG